MSNPQISNNPHSSVIQCPVEFLQSHPSLSSSLFAECDYDISKVKTLIEPVLKGRERCQVAEHYIQALCTGRSAFLVTNFSQTGQSIATAIGTSWLIGRSSSCAVQVEHLSVSRRHAVLGWHRHNQLFITDLGSSNGTWLNGHRLPLAERYPLQDGDVIRFGVVSVEFFVAGQEIPDSLAIADTVHSMETSGL
jgi:hypothetical protein